MISSEVQRTLVKSPPELWAELSDPKSLARHLGELGEIRITKAEPEKLVEWEAQEARGSVAIKASGWGTKVTLKASRDYTPAAAETAEPQAPEVELAEAAAAEVQDVPQDVEAPSPSPSGLDAWSRQEADVTATAAERFEHGHPATLLGTDLELAADRELETTEAEPEQPEAIEPAEPEVEAPQPKLGFFARLFGRGRRKVPVATPMTEAAPTEQPALEAEVRTAEQEPHESASPIEEATPAAELDAATTGEPVLETGTGAADETPAAQPTVAGPDGVPAAEDPTPEVEDQSSAIAVEAAEETPPVDLAAELRAAEEAAEEEVRMILTGVLDRLGAAHHRPFSRA